MKGLDIGTSFIVSAKKIDGNIVYESRRDAFFEVESGGLVEKMLDDSQVSYFKSDNSDTIYIIGDHALEFSMKFGGSKGVTKRPLAKGTVNPQEQEALPILGLIIKSVLGDPSEPNESVVYSIPANSVDVDNNVVFHEKTLEAVLKRMGYSPRSYNEAMAIVLAELSDEKYTGMAISWGAGMCNVALSFMSQPIMTFSVARSGDWIDQESSKACGLSISKITQIKEKHFNLMDVDYTNQAQASLAIYYENLINYVIKNICEQFVMTRQDAAFEEPITVVLSGGTSKVPGFDKKFAELFDKTVLAGKFPIKVKKVKSAKDPMTAVAEGCLLVATNKM